MADRYGRKLMVCRAMVAGSVTLLPMSYARTIPELLLCRLLQGAFSGTFPASIALVASVVPRRRSGFALGMMQAAVFIGSTIGPFFGGMAADAFGYRVSFRLSNSMANSSFPLVVKDFGINPMHLNSMTGTIMAVSAVAAAFSAGILGHNGDGIFS